MENNVGYEDESIQHKSERERELVRQNCNYIYILEINKSNDSGKSLRYHEWCSCMEKKKRKRGIESDSDGGWWGG